MKKEEAEMNNLRIFLDKGPGLHRDYSTWIVAKDSVHNEVLLGGLGGMGCGEMWVTEEDRHKMYLGYSEAQEQDSTGGMHAITTERMIEITRNLGMGNK